MSGLTGTIKIEGDVEFFYEDSGINRLIPSTCTTVVLVHGMGFNGAVFRRLFPFGPEHNYRLVSLHRRGYPRSSPLTREELALLQSSDAESQKKYLRLVGLQIARFILNFAASQAIPSYDTEHKLGGVVLLGWSVGALYLNAMLANLDGLAVDELHSLENFLHTTIYYDMGQTTLGIPGSRLDEGTLYAAELAERWKLFMKWVPGFFAHRDVYSRDLKDLESNTPRGDKPGSFHDLTSEELEEITCVDAFATHEQFTLAMKPEVYVSLARRALFDAEAASAYLPRLKARFVCATESAGLFVGAVHELGRCLEHGPAVVYGKGAEHARDVKLKYLERGNHFVFWDEPQWALGQFKACVEQ